jgi:hypothetical protein
MAAGDFDGLLDDLVDRFARDTLHKPRAIPISGGLARGPQAPIPVQVADCGGATGTWVSGPGFSIVDARITGTVPHEVFIHIYFEVDLRLYGELRCADNCGNTRAQTRVEYFVTLPLRLEVFPARFLLPGYIKLLLLLRDVIRAGARVVDFILNNEELMRDITRLVDPMLALMRNSANLICAGVFDPGQFREYIERRLREGIGGGRMEA